VWLAKGAFGLGSSSMLSEYREPRMSCQRRTWTKLLPIKDQDPLWAETNEQLSECMNS